MRRAPGLTVLIIITLMALPVAPAPSCHWLVVAGGSGNERFDSVIEAGGDLVAAGGSDSFSSTYDIVLTRFDMNGSLHETLVLDSGDEDLLGGMAGDGDAVYVFGTTFGMGASDSGGDVFLARFGVGEGGLSLEWIVLINASDYDEATGAIGVLEDGSVVVAGNTYSYGASGDIFVARFYGNGSLAWYISMGGSGGDSVKGLVVGDDGYIYIAGYTYVSGSGYKPFVAKINYDGALLWAYAYGSGYFYGVSYADGALYVAGHINYGSFPNILSNISVASINSSTGEVLWYRVISDGGKDEALAIVAAPNGDVYAAGSTSAYQESGYAQMLVMRLSGDGELLNYTVVGLNKSGASSMTIYSGYLVSSGYVSSIGEGEEDGLLLLYSPALGPSLGWSGGEAWPPVPVGDHSANVSVEPVQPAAVPLNWTISPHEPPTYTGAPTLSQQSYSEHVACDSNTPVPVPEAQLLVLVVMAVSVTAMLAALLARRGS